MSKQKMSDVSIGETVSFHHQGRELSGVVARLAGQTAFVLGEDRNSYRLAVECLRLPGQEAEAPEPAAAALPIPSASNLQIDEEVLFSCRDRQLRGRIVSLNSRRAHVLCDNDEEYAVPYRRILAQSQELVQSGGRRLEAVRQQADALLEEHGLATWRFDFDHATRRAGCCDYRRRRISLALQFARRASEAEITDTLLHEIAHALVGRKHNHNAVWRAKAQEIGSSGERCHDSRFCPPRYIISCRNGCWSATAERRRRHLVCRQCRGKLSIRPTPSSAGRKNILLPATVDGLFGTP
ncbi:MAG: SprT-like domain-containing protein [Syntrophotaleaceae bacterium]